MIRVRPGRGAELGVWGLLPRKAGEVYGGSRTGPGLVARNVSHVTDRDAAAAEVELSFFDQNNYFVNKTFRHQHFWTRSEMVRN